MQFQKYDLGQLKRGRRVQVTLRGTAANVRLMNSSNFNAYRNGRSHRYIGGLVKQSPWVGVVPSSGHWYVTVDMIGLRGRTQSSVQVLPEALPTARSANTISSPVRDVADNLAELIGDTPRQFDVFISHASEDKDSVARPLAEELRRVGLDVWYDEFTLRIGDSLRRTIDQGIANARFGIVVLSPDFFGKGWTNYELDGIVTAQVTGKQIVLPIWHNVSHADVFGFSPSLAGRKAAVTSETSITQIAQEIAEVIGSRP